MTITNLVPEADYAAARGVSIRTIQRERALRIGAPFIKLGRKIFYRPESLEAWIVAQEQVQPRAASAKSTAA